MNEHKAEIPEPSLTYYQWTRHDWSPNVITDDVVALYAVYEVTVSRDPYGAIYAYLRGPMRKRDGERGRQSRSIRVKPHPDQPHWLTMLFADALTRLPNRPGQPGATP